MKNKYKICEWFEGAEEEWKRINHLYAEINETFYNGKTKKRKLLRRQLIAVIRKGLAKARYKGQLLGALGNAIQRNDQRLNTLLISYKTSKKEGDYYNCLLVADSLAQFFTEDRFDRSKAKLWIKRTKQWLNRYEDVDIRKNIVRLSKLVAQNGLE